MAIEREFTRHARGDFTPANCLRCERTDDLVDVGASDIQYYGRVYLCAVCVAELAMAMGYVDDSVHEQKLAAANSEAAHWKGQYAIADENARTVPRRVKAATERLANGIRSLADDFGLSIVSAASGDASDDVPAHPAGDASQLGGAGHLPREGGRADGGGRPVPAGRGERPAVLEPAGDERRFDGNDLGAGSPAEPAAEVDGSDADASFGWIEHVAGPDGDHPAVGDDPTGD